jgi:hypothetical protein
MHEQNPRTRLRPMRTGASSISRGRWIRRGSRRHWPSVADAGRQAPDTPKDVRSGLPAHHPNGMTRAGSSASRSAAADSRRVGSNAGSDCEQTTRPPPDRPWSTAALSVRRRAAIAYQVGGNQREREKDQAEDEVTDEAVPLAPSNPGRQIGRPVGIDLPPPLIAALSGPRLALAAGVGLTVVCPGRGAACHSGLVRPTGMIGACRWTMDGLGCASWPASRCGRRLPLRSKLCST